MYSNTDKLQTYIMPYGKFDLDEYVMILSLSWNLESNLCKTFCFQMLYQLFIARTYYFCSLVWPLTGDWKIHVSH